MPEQFKEQIEKCVPEELAAKVHYLSQRGLSLREWNDEEIYLEGNIMTKQEAIILFQSIHPNFFEQEYIQSLSEDWVFDEMILRLEDFDTHKYEKILDTSITFDFFEGNCTELLKAVEQVDSDWKEFFDGEDRVFCGYHNGKVVSFCLISNMGIHEVNGKRLKIGGPGCVGTLPEYRDKGIGLMMVKKATQVLKEEGYDYSYIHYTYVAQWYAKLGYETVLKWTKNGIDGFGLSQKDRMQRS